MTITQEDNYSTRTIEYAAGRARVIDFTTHPVDRHLPAHWEGVRHGQSSEERSAAILVNVRRDQIRRSAGVDPATGRRIITPTDALARVAALKRNLPN